LPLVVAAKPMPRASIAVMTDFINLISFAGD